MLEEQPNLGAKPITRWETGLQWLLGGLAIGVLWATNSWDFPTYLVIGSLAVIFATYREIGRFDIKMAGLSLIRVIALAVLSIITFWPYYANYGQGYSSITFWPGSYTKVRDYLVIYGLFLFIIITYLFIEFRSWTKTWSYEQLKKLEGFSRLIILALVLFVVIIGLFALGGYLIAPLTLTLIVTAGLLGLRPGIDAARRTVLILIASALGLTLLVEIFVLDGDIGRMNTVFKFYMQAWLILSVASGTAVIWNWERIRQKTTIRKVWQIGLAILLAVAALYPLLATRAKWQIRMSQEAPNTLDGMAFMPYVQYGDTNYLGESTTISLGDDYEALRWMQRNIEGSPVILEAHGSNPYRSIVNRVAMYTGLPAVVGWDWHQRQQRAVLPGNLVKTRIEDVNNLYNTLDIELAENLLNKYNVQYIYAGQLEHEYYQPEGLGKFKQMVELGLLEIVYQNSTTTIYKVKETNEA